MVMNQYTFILVIWVLAFGFIIYERTKSNLIILTCLSIITIILAKTESTNDVLPEILTKNTEMLEWIDSMFKSTNEDDRYRCYNEIRNMLYSDSLLKDKTDHGYITAVIEKYKPELPIAHNHDLDTNYSISTGFTRN